MRPRRQRQVNGGAFCALAEPAAKATIHKLTTTFKRTATKRTATLLNVNWLTIPSRPSPLIPTPFIVDTSP
jgi:hypothetical protein